MGSFMSRIHEFNLCLEFMLKDVMSRFFLHEFETRICFMNSRHEWALPCKSRGCSVLEDGILRAGGRDAACWRAGFSALEGGMQRAG